jgi:hypothetical protein
VAEPDVMWRLLILELEALVARGGLISHGPEA